MSQLATYLMGLAQEISEISHLLQKKIISGDVTEGLELL
jgi:hypothetical protein